MLSPGQHEGICKEYDLDVRCDDVTQLAPWDGSDRALLEAMFPQVAFHQRTGPSPSTPVPKPTQSPASPMPSTPTPQQMGAPSPPRPLTPFSTYLRDKWEIDFAEFNMTPPDTDPINVLHEVTSTANTAEPDVTHTSSHGAQAKGTRQDGNN